MNCININHPSFIELLEETKLNTYVLEMRVAKWQETNKTDKFPEAKDVADSKGYFQLNNKSIEESTPKEVVLNTTNTIESLKQLRNIQLSFTEDFARGIMIGERESQKNYLLKYLKDEKAVDYIVNYAKENDLLGKQLEEVFLHIQANLLLNKQNYLRAINLFSQQADQKLDQKLKDFLKEKLNVNTIFDFNDHPGGVIAAADILNKQLTLFKDGKLDTIAEETGHFFFESISKENDIYFKLLDSVETWNGYSKVYEDYKNIYFTPSGEVDVNKIKREAIGQAIGQGIVRNFKAEEGNTFFKALQEVLDQIKHFLNLFKIFNFEVVIDDIAKEILDNDIRRITNEYNSTDFEKKSAIDKSKYPVISKIIEGFKKINAEIVGSLSYREYGDLYREVDEDVHDIDVSIPYSEYKGDIQSFFNKIKEQFPNFRYNYKDKQTKEIATWKDDYNDNIIYQIYIDDMPIDLFFTSEQVKEGEKGKKSWFDAFVVKYNYRRPKDMFDILNWKNFEQVNLNDNPSVFYQQEQVKPGVNEIFESNSELANSVYEVLGFKQKSKERNSAFTETLNSVENTKIGEQVSLHKIFPHIADAFVTKTKDGNYYIEHTEDLLNKQQFEDYLLDRFKPTEKQTDVRYLEVTEQQKQQALQQYSQYLNTIFPDSKVKDIVYHGSYSKNINKFSKDIIGRTSLTGFLPKGFYFTNQKYVASTYTANKDVYNKAVWDSLIAVLEGIKDEDGNYYQDPRSFEKLLSYIGESNENKEYIIDYRDGKLQDSSGGAAEAGLILPSKEDVELYLKLIKTKDLKGIKEKRDSYSDEEGVIFPVILNIKNSLNKKSQTGSITTINLEGKTTGDKRQTLEKELKNSDGLIVSDIRDASDYSSKREIKYDENIDEKTYVVFEPEQIHILGSKQDIEGFKEFVNNTKEPLQENPDIVKQKMLDTLSELDIVTMLQENNIVPITKEGKIQYKINDKVEFIYDDIPSSIVLYSLLNNDINILDLFKTEAKEKIKNPIDNKVEISKDILYSNKNLLETDLDILNERLKLLNYDNVSYKLNKNDNGTYDIKYFYKSDTTSEQDIDLLVNKLKKVFPQLKIALIDAKDMGQYLDRSKLTEDTWNSIPSFVIGDTVYLVNGRYNTANTIEELLHPFVNALYLDNNELFNTLYEEAVTKYPELLLEITGTYRNIYDAEDIKKEFLTQVLQQEYQQPKYSVLSKFINWLKSVISKLTDKPINVKDLKNLSLSQITMLMYDDNARIFMDSFENKTFFHIDDVLKSKIQAIQNRVGTNSIQDNIIETILKNQVVTFTENNHTYQDKDGKLYTSVTTKIKGTLDESDPEIAKYEINRTWGTQLDYIAEQILLGKEIEQSKIKDLPKNVVDNFELSFRGFVASETMNGSVILPQIVLNSAEDEIAGKPDYLIITKDGKIKILDLKASKNSIEDSKHENSKFDTLLKNEGGNVIRLSTRGQHTVQVKSYAKMLENYGLEVTDIHTLHYKEKVKETFNDKKELVSQELEDIYLEGAIDHNKPDYIDERILAEQIVQTIQTEQAEDDTAKREQRKINSAQNIIEKLNKLVEDWKITLNTKVIKSQNFKNYVSELAQFIDILKEESNPEIVYGELIDFYSKRLLERNQSVEKILNNNEEITVNRLNIFKHYAEETEFVKTLLQQTELLVSNPYINGLALNLNESLEDFLGNYELFTEKAIKQTLENTLQGEHDVNQLLNEAIPTSNDISTMSTYARRVVESGDALLTTVDTLVKNKLQYVKDLMKQFQSEVSSFAKNVMLNHNGKKGEEFYYMLTKNKKGEVTGHIIDNLDWYKYKEVQDEYYKNCYNAEGKLRSLETVDKSLTKEEQQIIRDKNIELWRARKKKREFDQEERVINGLIEDGEFHKYNDEFQQARDKYFEPRINEKYDTVHWDVKEGVTKKELIAYYSTYYTAPVEYASMIMYKGQPTGEIEWKEQRFPKREFIEKVTTQENGLLNPKYTEILSWKNSSNSEQKAKYDFYMFYTTKMKELIKLLPEKQGHKLNGQIAKIKQRLMTEATVNMKGGWFKVFLDMIKSIFSLKSEASSVMVYSDNEIDQETLPILFVADFKSESLINYLKLKKDFIRLSYRNLTQDAIVAQLIDKGATQKQIQSFFDLKLDFKNYKNYKLELNKTEQALYLETSKITAGELETNLGENLTVFAEMVYGYDSMSSIENIIQLIKDKIKNKKYTVETSLGDKLKGKNTNEEAFVTGENSNIYKRLDSYLKMTYYKTSRPFDSKIGQFSKKMLSLMSLRSVGLNPFGQFNNYLIGKISNFIETNPFGQTGLYWNKSHINEADLEYKKSLIDFSNSLDKGHFKLEHLKTNKYDAIVDFFNMERGYTPAGTYGQFSVKDHLLEKSFYMQQKIEYALQTKTGVSILMAKELTNSITGEKSSVYNAMEFNKQKGVVQFKEGFSLKDNEKYALTNFIYEVNASIHGNYAIEDKMAIQSSLLGELVTVYRKHIVPGFDQRFRKAYYNDVRGWQEGRYVTAQQFFNSIVELKNLRYAWDSLSDRQKINMQKNLTELGFVVATFVITGLLAVGADDDDSKLYNSFRVAIDKLNSEMLFYYPIVGVKQQAQFLKNPSAALSYAGDWADIFTAGAKTSLGDPYFKTGINKGELRLTKEFMDVLPILQLVNKWQSYETVKSFYIK